MSAIITRPPGTIPFADTERWKGGFGVQSDSNPDRLYTVSFDTAGGYWVCSCPGGVNRGSCKHLARYGKSPTRADAKAAVEQAEADAKLANEIQKAVRAAQGRVKQKRQARVRSLNAAAYDPKAPLPEFEPSPIGAALPRIPGDLTIPVARRFRAPGEV